MTFDLNLTLQIDELVRPHGLISRGAFSPARSDHLVLDNGEFAGTLVLVGSAGSGFWPVFSSAREYQDEQDHALDRWSRRIGDAVASELRGKAIYPGDGPPYHPFQTWARLCDERVSDSPLGILMHSQYGLWHAFRFALLLPDQRTAEGIVQEGKTVCSGCRAKPCLNACPVDAFSERGYDHNCCREYLRNTPQAECWNRGCLARLRCPVAAEFQYVPGHARFHLSAFVTSLDGGNEERPTK